MSRLRGACALCALVILLADCGGQEQATERSAGSKAIRAREEGLGREPLQPLPVPAPIEPGLTLLGRRLFEDKRLSSDGTIACASCHDLESGGDDGLPRSLGVGRHAGAVNAPTVLNAALNFVLFWDGRAKTLEEQIDGPIANPLEMSTTWPDIVSKLGRDAGYVSAFRRAFADGITADNVRAAIAGFERTLLTRGSPFDRWLEGDAGALSAPQRAGYELFKTVGCIACHQGRNVGGNMFQRFGVMGDYFADRGSITQADYGRFNVTGNESDRFVFRVPSLRNVERTAPYFHDGSAPTLARAVQVMARYQLGRQLTDEQVSTLVAFLGSLTGPLPSVALGKAR